MKTIKTMFVSSALVALAIVGTSAFSQTTTSSNSTDEMSNAEVRKVDKAQGKVTLKHGPIKNLDMPGMTMVFSVKDKTVLDTIKPGDKVKFKAVDENGKLTVVEMMPAK